MEVRETGLWIEGAEPARPGGRSGRVRPQRSGTRTRTLLFPAASYRTRLRGFGPGVGGPKGPVLRGVVTAWRHPEIRGRSRISSSRRPPGTQTRLPSPAGTPQQRPGRRTQARWEQLPLARLDSWEGRPLPGHSGAPLQAFCQMPWGRGRAGRLRLCGAVARRENTYSLAVLSILNA